MNYLVLPFKVDIIGNSFFLTNEKGILKIEEKLANILEKIHPQRFLTNKDISEISNLAKEDPLKVISFFKDVLFIIKDDIGSENIESIIIIADDSKFVSIVKNELENSFKIPVLDMNSKNDHSLVILFNSFFRRDELNHRLSYFRELKKSYLLSVTLLASQVVVSNIYDPSIGSPCPLCFFNNQNDLTLDSSKSLFSILKDLNSENINLVHSNVSELDMSVICKYTMIKIRNFFNNTLKKKTLYQTDILDIDTLDIDSDVSIHNELCNCLSSYYIFGSSYGI